MAGLFKKLPTHGIVDPTGGHATLAGLAMIEGVRYVHTNLIAQDWRRLADFYTSVFGCEVVPPIRDFPASAVEAGTGVPGASLSGVHLRLPGHDATGPTIEIFTYSKQLEHPPVAANRAGFGHIAFAVPSVPLARAEVLAAGGKPIGEIVRVTSSTGRQITWCYVTDLEGNIIELQAVSWRFVSAGSHIDQWSLRQLAFPAGFWGKPELVQVALALVILVVKIYRSYLPIRLFTPSLWMFPYALALTAGFMAMIVVRQRSRRARPHLPGTVTEWDRDSEMQARIDRELEDLD